MPRQVPRELACLPAAIGELRPAERVHLPAEGELVHHPRRQQILADPPVDRRPLLTAAGAAITERGEFAVNPLQLAHGLPSASADAPHASLHGPPRRTRPAPATHNRRPSPR